MCLGVPGQVIEWLDRDPVFGRALIEFDGIRRVCLMACVPEAGIGDYVIVHAGIAISRIDASAAENLLAELRLLDDLEADTGAEVEVDPIPANCDVNKGGVSDVANDHGV